MIRSELLRKVSNSMVKEKDNQAEKMIETYFNSFDELLIEKAYKGEFNIVVDIPSHLKEYPEKIKEYLNDKGYSVRLLKKGYYNTIPERAFISWKEV